MAVKDLFQDFFKRRREEAEGNIRRAREFKQKFIAEPLQKIPKLVTEDLFKMEKERKKKVEQIKQSTQKIQDFQKKYFVGRPSGISEIAEKKISRPIEVGTERISEAGRRFFKPATERPVSTSFFKAPFEAQERVGAELGKTLFKAPEFIYKSIFGDEERRREFRGKPSPEENIARGKMGEEEIEYLSSIGFGLAGPAPQATKPLPLTGISDDILKAAKTRLEGLGFANFKDATAIKRQFRSTIMKLHPDKGGDPDVFKQFMDDFEKVTSAKVPFGTEESMVDWIKGVWKRVKPEPKVKPTGREVTKTGDELVRNKISVTAPTGKIAQLEASLTEKAFNTANKVLKKTGDRDVAYSKARSEINTFRGQVVKNLWSKYKLKVDPNKSKYQQLIEIPEAKKTLDEVEKASTRAGDILYADWMGEEAIRAIEPVAKKFGAGGIEERLKSSGITFETPVISKITDQDVITFAKGGRTIEAINKVADRIGYPEGEERAVELPRVLNERLQGMVKEGQATVERIPDETEFTGFREVYGFPSEKPRITTTGLEKEITEERITSMLKQSKSSEDYSKRVRVIASQLDKPEVRANKPKLRQVRAVLQKQLSELTGQDLVHWKQARAMLEMMKGDPETQEVANSLEDAIVKMDDAIGSREATKAFETVRKDANLPLEGKVYIPYGKYTTRGTRNREWVQTINPMVYMGNKRGMVGYILDVLGIEQKDLGSLAPTDVSHLKRINNVVDVFGGSGLLTELSRKIFPNAKLQYNELDSGLFNAISTATGNPKAVTRYISQVGKYLHDNPGADWLAHFSYVYKENPNFRVAAKLIEMAGGRTGEITSAKITNLIKAVPKFSEIFREVDRTQKDAWKLLDHYIRNGTKKDFLWIDPPYLWSTGYNVGAEMEKARGFIKLLKKLDKLNAKGVKFIFFNNDPKYQATKAGLESVYLDNIMGNINKLAKNKVTTVFDIKPVGADRRELILTNVNYGKETGRLLRLDNVIKAIEELKSDPATAPREVLKLYRNIRESSRFIPPGQRISPNQIARIRALRSSLRIKNREMVPVLDELLGDTSFARMTKEDGVRMIEWLQPRNWDVIENKIALTREMLAEERRRLAVGDRFVAKDEELESKFRMISTINRTVSDIENLAGVMRNIPAPEQPRWNLLRRAVGAAGAYLPEEITSKILGIRSSFQVPVRVVIDIGRNHENRMKKVLTDIFKDLTPAEREQVIYLQADAAKYYQGDITEKARQYADYIQELAKANIAIVNRLREAIGQKPLKAREPYIPYIVDENLEMASRIYGDKVKFWETRTKTPRDFAVGLFTKDPERIMEVWAESSGSWLKKNLYGAFLRDKMDTFYDVSTPAGTYAKMVVDMDIYDMISDNEKLLRSIGVATNEALGSIFPKKIPVSEELASSILNTRFGQELRESIENGYLTVPRVQIPNVGVAFHKVFYPAKLAWNMGFYFLNRTQPFAGIPFTGLRAALTGRLKMYQLLFPWSKAERQRYMQFLEESGYEYGRVIEGNQLPGKPKDKIGKFVDGSVNFLASFSEFQNRVESMISAKYFLESKDAADIKLSEDDRMRIAAQFSAFINFLGGKGYAPLAQRTTWGRFAYVFTQYPLNQINVYHEMIKTAMSDKATKELWTKFADEGISSEVAHEFINKLPPAKRGKVLGNIFLILLALALPAAYMYALSRSWNVASRALPGLPRVTFSDLFISLTNWMNDPTDENLADLKNQIKSTFRIESPSRLRDALDILKTGMITTRSGRPVFVDKELGNALKTLVFGRSSLEEYENQYPSILAEKIGGKTEAGEAERLRSEQEKGRQEDTQTAVEAVRFLSEDHTAAERVAYFMELRTSGRLTEGAISKMKTYLEERGRKTGGLERNITSLNDKQQAQFVLDKFYSVDGREERASLLQDYQKRGILTENVIAEMKKLTQEGYQPEKNGIFEGLFAQ